VQRGTMTPVIGITTYEDQASWRGWSARAAMLPFVYVDAVRRSGGRAVLLPPGGDDDEAGATVASLDGLVVAGGPDIDPVRYGAARHPRTQAPATLRDAWDLSVTSHALRLGVPLLAICRGMQVLDVCRDGAVDAVEAGPSELDGFSGFVLGVQWHPEQGSDPRLFTALVEAAAARGEYGVTAERATTEDTVLAPMI